MGIAGAGATGNVVLGNDIGTDSTGENPLPNEYAGVVIDQGASDNTIGGLSTAARNVISGNGYFGVYINEGPTDNTVEGNYIGTDAMGTSALPNIFDGVYIEVGTANTIGGTAVGAGNVISGNEAMEVEIGQADTTGNIVEGNDIGTDYTGTTVVADGYTGVAIDWGATDNTIGGTTAAARNVISGDGDGVSITDYSDPATAGDNLVEGNFIGTDDTGTVVLPDQQVGVEILNSGNLIGGATTGAGNVISGNTAAGIEIDGAYGATSGNAIEGNAIGTDVTGTLALGNGGEFIAGSGVVIEAGASDNTIGGTSSGDANTIAFNTGNGITVGDNSTDTTIGDEILGNSIYSNGGIGIDLGNDGVTSNDSEGHSGPNLFQNFPVITEATSSTTTGSISATLSSTPNTTFTIEFFASTELASGVGGETYIGELTNVKTDSSGNKSFTFYCPAFLEPIITATATDPSGNTSEFSLPFYASVPTPIVVTNTNDSGDGSLRAAIVSADNQGAGQIITFDIPTSDPNYFNGVFLIQPQTPLPAITTMVSLDGTSQPGYTGRPIIDFDGFVAGGSNGLEISQYGSDSTIRGLDITDWNPGVGISIDAGATGVQIVGNSIGLLAGSFVGLGNEYGVLVFGSGNTVGGTTAADRNVISGNTFGVAIADPYASGNTVEGNYIGIDSTGGTDTSAVPNFYNGVEIVQGASDNTIGGTAAGASNVISGNGQDGVDIDGTTGNVVEGDDIGTDSTGGTDGISVPNGFNGVEITDGGNDNTIGGAGIGSLNVISGNTYDGVEIDGTGTLDNIVEGDYIGTDSTGGTDNLSVPNHNDGVEIFGGALDNTIGGIAAGPSNVISGNTVDGVEISGSSTTGNFVLGNNDIGTDSTGGTDGLSLPNNDGVVIDQGAYGNTVGGTAAANPNVISGNANGGVYILGASENLVQGDFVGTDSTGGADGILVPNEYIGVGIANGATDNLIGGDTAGASDMISGNGYGVNIASAGTSGNVVEGDNIVDNYIGVSINNDASGNTIGGSVNGDGNLIAGNGESGVQVGYGQTDATIDNAIVGNSIYGNAYDYGSDGLGIDLGSDGVTPNHSSPTSGVIAGAPNGDQNSPVIASATFVPDVSDSNGTLIVSGSLAADQGKTYIIQLFVDASADPSGYGQGQTLIASFDVTTDGVTGDVIFSKSLATANLTGEVISATATDPNGNTSEFAQDVTVASGTGSDVNVPADGGAAATAAVLQQVVSELQSLPTGTTPPAVLLDVTSRSELDSVIAAINGLTSQAEPPVTVIVDLGGVRYEDDTTVNAPGGIDVVIQNGTLVGGSPALIVDGGSVMLNNVLATNATSAPTILINGGSLTVRDSTIDASSVSGEAAFSLTGGTLDLGTTSSPGDNTINISTDTQFVQNATTGSVPAVGDTFNVNGATQTATELSFTSFTGPTTSPAYGQSVTLNTSVVPDYPGDPAPSGSLYFLDETNGMTLGPAQVSGGMASFSTTALALGANDLIALYSGDSRYLLSLSAPISVTVIQPALSVTSIASVSPNPRNTAVGSIDVTFSEPVNLATFTDAALCLTDNGGSNLITDAVTVSAVSGSTSTSTYQINGLSGLTAAQGEYTLTVNSAKIQDQNGNAGSNSLSTQWLMDTTPPTSTIRSLPERETTLVFPVTATGTDGGSPPSGIASFDIYSSTNGGPWTFWTNVAASSPTADFTGTSTTTYAFYSVAHDLAGNVQADKPFIEASTYVPDLIPPVTAVDGTTGTNPSTLNSTTGTFSLDLTGSDPGGGLLTYFAVFVSIDGGAYQEVGPYAIPAGAPDSKGSYHSTVPYQGLTDGQSHTYSFYSIGLDSAGKKQSAPTSPNVTFSSETFAVPGSLQVTSFSVEHDSPGRSFIRYLDIGFNESDSQSGGKLTTIVNSIGTSSPDIVIYKYDLNGDASSKTAVSLSGVSVDVIDHAIEINFGSGGIGGGPTTTAADGYYEVDIKPPGGPVAVHHFYRLLGDVDGDGVVDASDLNEIAASINETSPAGWAPLAADVTGSSTVTALDLTLGTRSKGRALGHGLSLG